jgi:prolyl oligopeptidase
MIKSFVFAVFLASIYGPLSAQTLESVPTESEPLEESFYGISVSDPYRYLENLNSERVDQWVKAQNKVANKYLNKLRNKSNASARLERFSYADYKLPYHEGKYYFRLMHSDENSGAGLYYQRELNGIPVLLIDPLEISPKDKITLGTFKLSKNSKYLAYQFHRDGSDWAEIQVMNMSGGRRNDHLKHVKFSAITWQGDGFYYTVFQVSDSLAALRNEEIYYHKLGDNQESDRLVFRRLHRPTTEFNIQVTTDERFLIIREKDEERDHLNYFIQDAEDTIASLKPFFRNPKHSLEILDSQDGSILALTMLDSSNLTVVKIDPNNPQVWLKILPEVEKTVLKDVLILAKYIAVVYQVGTHQKLVFFTYDGNIAHIEYIPQFCALGDLNGNKYDKELIYFYESYLFPPVVYTINLETFRSKLLQKTQIAFDYTDFEIREVEYPSKDGTLVPMMLLNKKGMKRNGNNPTLLTAYGGFGISSEADFKPALIYFLEEGGVFAIAKIRGGGDKGMQWHRMGSGVNKQNSFDDFIAAAEYLIRENYTAPQQLAITGASNGGLVVGVAMTQRPDLFAVAVPVVGVFDMLRFEKFTIGTFHRDEYGTVATEAGFKQLLAYSPLHHIQPGVNYPATLIVTAENDDRVPPFHSYKFASTLQNNPGQTNPVLLLVEKDAGHHGYQTIADRLEYEAGVYSFILKHTRK